MAKISNEAALIIKLAKERMLILLKATTDCSDQESPFKSGYKIGVRDYATTLQEIADELEKR